MIQSSVSLAPMTWFRTGGKAEYFAQPTSLEDLQDLVRRFPDTTTVLGLGSNLLVRSGGIRGLVIRLDGHFKTYRVDASSLLVGAGTPGAVLAQVAARHGLMGLEFMSGVPGTVGGAVRMNAGAHEQDTSRYLKTVWALDRKGRLHELSSGDLSFSYRSSSLPKGWILTQALFVCPVSTESEVRTRMASMRQKRRLSQPIKERTGGSTFKNPPHVKAWELIEQAGCRGLTCGAAAVSDLHCNFLVNKGQATSEDLEDLGQCLQRRVWDHAHIQLEWEIQRMGVQS